MLHLVADYLNTLKEKYYECFIGIKSEAYTLIGSLKLITDGLRQSIVNVLQIWA